MSFNYSAANMLILDTLGQDPETRYHVRAVAEKTGLSVGAASMILHTLEGTGMLTVEHVGNMKFYKYNLSNAFAQQWKMTFNIMHLKPLADDLRDMAERVVLFGSAADGTDTLDSDIDLFILTQHEVRVREIIANFKKRRRYFRPLSPIIMNATSFATLRRRDPSLYKNILGGRSLWERG